MQDEGSEIETYSHGLAGSSDNIPRNLDEQIACSHN